MVTDPGSGFATCPICGGTERKDKRSKWTACVQCGALLRDPWPDSHELRAIYQEAFHTKNPSRGTMKATNERLANEFVGLLRSNGLLVKPHSQKIVDFGAGFGHMSLALQRAGHDVKAVEPYGMAAVRRRGIEVYRTIEQLKSAHNGATRFNGIVMIEVLEHLSEPVGVLSNLRSLLLPGGWLLATTPNAGSLSAKLLRSRWQGASKPSHLVLYKAPVVIRAFTGAGFEEVRLVRHPIRFSDRWLRGTLQSLLQLVGLGGSLKVLARTSP